MIKSHYKWEEYHQISIENSKQAILKEIIVIFPDYKKTVSYNVRHPLDSHRFGIISGRWERTNIKTKAKRQLIVEVKGERRQNTQ